MNDSISAPMNPYLERLLYAWPNLPFWYKAKVYMMVVFLGTYGLLKKRLAEKVEAIRKILKRRLYLMTKKWITKITVEFVPLPKEKEAAYWAAIGWFAKEMLKLMAEEMAANVAEEKKESPSST